MIGVQSVFRAGDCNCNRIRNRVCSSISAIVAGDGDWNFRSIGLGAGFGYGNRRDDQFD